MNKLDCFNVRNFLTGLDPKFAGSHHPRAYAFVWTNKRHDQSELMGTCCPPAATDHAWGESVFCFKTHTPSTWYEKFHIFQMALTSSNHEWTLLWDTQHLSTGHFCPQGPFCCFRPNAVSQILSTDQLWTQEKSKVHFYLLMPCVRLWLLKISPRGLYTES